MAFLLARAISGLIPRSIKQKGGISLWQKDKRFHLRIDNDEFLRIYILKMMIEEKS
jgi:hypothetical protein